MVAFGDDIGDREIMAVYRAIIRAIVDANDTVDGAVGEVQYALGQDAADLTRDALTADPDPWERRRD